MQNTDLRPPTTVGQLKNNLIHILKNQLPG